MSELDMFGAETPRAIMRRPIDKVPPWLDRVLPLALAALAAWWSRRSHPVLAALGTAAAVSNLQAVMRGERTVKQAAQRVGRHAVATAASLATPSHPAIAWLAGAFAAELLFDGHGSGIVDEWTRNAGMDIDTKRQIT